MSLYIQILMHNQKINAAEINGGFFPYGLLAYLDRYDYKCLIEEAEAASSGNGKVGDGVGGGGAGGW